MASLAQVGDARPQVAATYISGLLREMLQANGDGRLHVSTFEGVVLFVDIAGSTPLVNRFAEAGPQGVEDLHRVLNRYFGTLFDIVQAHSGDVIAILGDAVLAVWRGDAALEPASRQAAAAALQIRDRSSGWSDDSGHLLQHRLVMSSGTLKAFAGRGDREQSFFVLTGAPIQVLASESHRGAPDEIIVTPVLAACLEQHAHLERSAAGVCQLVSLRTPASGAQPATSLAVDAQVDVLARSFVPRMLIDRLLAGRAEWLAEFRVLTVAFVQLVNLDSAPAARLQRALHEIDERIEVFGLAIFRLSVDDKGVVAVVASGLPPYSQERNAARGLEAARKLHTHLHGLGIECSIGVATGRAFCGDVGNALRHEGLITGPVMHRAARLMAAAAGGLLCDSATVEATADDFAAPEPTTVAVPGFAEPLVVYRGEDFQRVVHSPGNARNALHGRDDALHTLDALLDALAQAAHTFAVIEAEAGAGKSRVLAHAAAMARGHEYTCIETASSPIEGATAYYACRELVRHLLLQPADGPDANAARLRTRLDEALAGDPLREKAALIEDVLPLGIADKELAAEITGPARFTGVEDIVVRLAELRSSTAPLVLLVDDLHWIDDRSARLLLALTRRVPRIGLILTTRSLDESVPPYVRTLYDAASTRITLGRLTPEAVLHLTCDVLGVRSVPPSVAEFVYSHSEGLPFHAEQLVLSLRDQGTLVIENGRCRVTAELSSSAVPTSLRDSILSRIDTLDATQQVLVKVASAIGRSFHIDMLQTLLPETTERFTLVGELRHLAAVGILDAHRLTHDTCAFRHVIVQETTYELLTFAQRKPLHARIAAYLEQHYASDLEPHYTELAEHSERAGRVEAAIGYRRHAAQLALRRYANYDALRHVDHIENLTAGMSNVPRTLHAELAQIRADACHELSRFAEAQRHFVHCARLNGIPVYDSRPRIAARAAFELGLQALHRVGAITKPRNAANREIERLTAHIYLRLAEHAYFNGDALRIMHDTLTSLNHAERVDAVAEVVEGFGGLAIGFGTARLHPLARFYRDRSIARAESQGRLHDQGFAHLLAAVYSFQAGAWEATERHCATGGAICERLGDRFRHQSCRVVESYVHIATGRYERAEALLRSLGEDAEQVENIPVRAWVLAGHAILDMIRGRPPTLALARLALARDETLHSAERLLCDGIEALAHLAAGNATRALDTAATGLHNMLETPPTMGIAFISVAAIADVYLATAEAAAASHRLSDATLAPATQACDAAYTFARKSTIFRPRALLIKGRLAMLVGRRARAESHWRDAFREASELHMPLEQALALAALANTAADTKERVDRERASVNLLRELGATPWGSRSATEHATVPAA
jgi:adenylate cyclase